MVTVLRSTAMALAIVALSGCAALFNPATQSVPVDSVPPAADVFVDGEFRGTTPLTLRLDNRAPTTLTLRLPDGRERTVDLERQFHGESFALSLVPVALTGGALLAIRSSLSGVVMSGVTTSSHMPGFVVYAFTYVPVAIAGTTVSVVSIGVDAATGRWYRLVPGEVVVVFDD